jgi:hypothetical protein
VVRRARALALALVLVAGGPATVWWLAQETGPGTSIDDAQHRSSVLAAKPDVAAVPVSPGGKDRRLAGTLGGLAVLVAAAAVAAMAWRGRTPVDDERGRFLLVALPAHARAPPPA